MCWPVNRPFGINVVTTKTDQINVFNNKTGESVRLNTFYLSVMQRLCVLNIIKVPYQRDRKSLAQNITLAMYYWNFIKVMHSKVACVTFEGITSKQIN